MKTKSIGIVGLGYVGLPLAVAFGKKIETIGFDISEDKIEEYKKRCDPTGEVSQEDFEQATMLTFTNNPSDLSKTDMLIVAVPTPIDKTKHPDLRHIVSASEVVGRNMKSDSIVVYESTVYPGVTEEICVPVLEKVSGMKCGKDFKIGYSPERINPGDKEHTLAKIVKVVAGQDEETLNEIAEVYELVVDAGIYKAESIKVAEAAKVIENTQRDLNIALMNELAVIFNRLNIDTKAVLEAAGTKWNFLKFTPGLVGGHCIGVDPYYLTYCAQKVGYHPDVILAGRRINDSMGEYIAQRTVKELINAGFKVHDARVAVLGLTFKENCPDIRNTKVVDIIKELNEFGIEPFVHDPLASEEEAKQAYGIDLLKEIPSNLEAVILAVAHDNYLNGGPQMIKNSLDSGKGVIIDVKGLFCSNDFSEESYRYWRL